MTLSLFAPAAPPSGPLVVSYGGGVNTIATLLTLRKMGLAERVAAIVMADPGSERRGTVHYRDVVMPPYLREHGFPPITVVSRVEEGVHRERAWRLETLYDECYRIGALPSVAYGWKKCSLKYKAQPQRWWLERQEWAAAEWAAGRRLVKVIGYDADESSRVRATFQDPWEDARLVPWYPLHEAMLTREDCIDLIAAEGLPSVPKSACTYCPNNTLEEWDELRRDEPEAFAAAVALSRNAERNIGTPEVVGLMRCNPHGKRQLHVYADGGYGTCTGKEPDAMPCECAL